MIMKGRIDKLLSRRVPTLVAAASILCMGIFGYTVLSPRSIVGNCYAQSTNPAQNQTGAVNVITSACVESTGYWCSATPVACEMTGMTSTATSTAKQTIKKAIESTANALEKKVFDEIEGFVEAALRSIENTEQEMIVWWDTMWVYNLQPGLRKMTTQMNTDIIQQTQDMHKAEDVRATNEAKTESAQQEADDKKTVPVDDTSCAAATASGGLGRAVSFSKAMRGGLQNRSSDAGSNRRGTRGAMGRASITKEKSDTYESTFCDPDDNGGQNICGKDVDPKFYNADTKATEILFNKLTIPVTNEKYQAATEAIVENLTGNPAAEPMAEGVLNGAAGREQFLMRRSWLARYAAAGSVPRMVAGVRMPGAGPDMAKWIAELRRGGAATPFITNSDLSANPSYREILHALTVDRFNSTTYANSLIADRNTIEMEKLSLSTFQLMLLREYYELLERTALTLAVQVSMMADQQPVLGGGRYTSVKGGK